MGIIIILICISITLALTFLGIFLWSIKSGQYDDTYTPSVRILFEGKKNKDQSSKSKDQSPKVEDTNESQTPYKLRITK